MVEQVLQLFLLFSFTVESVEVPVTVERPAEGVITTPLNQEFTYLAPVEGNWAPATRTGSLEAVEVTESGRVFVAVSDDVFELFEDGRYRRVVGGGGLQPVNVQALNADLNAVTSLRIHEPTQKLYIGTTARVVVWDLLLNTVDTVMGNGASDTDGDAATDWDIYYVDSLALNADGSSLWVADSSGNGRVVEVDLSLATPTARTLWPGVYNSINSCNDNPGAIVFTNGGLAFGPDDKLYHMGTVCFDNSAGGKQVLRTYDPNDGTTAVLREVAHTVVDNMDFDAEGNLYYANNSNHTIVRFTTGGAFEPIAGDGNLGSSGDGGPALGARLKNPQNAAVSTTGDVWIADFNNYAVRRVWGPAP